MDVQKTDPFKFIKDNTSKNFEIILASNPEKSYYLGAHRIYTSGDNNDNVDTENTYVMTHCEQIEGQEWKLIPIEKEKNVYEIEYVSDDYDQKGWKLHVPVDKEDSTLYRVVLSKENSSQFQLIALGDNGFQVQEVKTELFLTSHIDSFYRDQNSNHSYITAPGMSGDIWKIIVFSRIEKPKLLNIRKRRIKY